MELSHLMPQALAALQTVLSYFQTGFYHVNGVQGLLIAAVLAYTMSSWRRLPMTVLMAVAAHVALSVMIPVLANGAAFRLPPLVELGYIKYLASLLAGYVVVISLFFLVKTAVLGGGGSHGHSAGHDHGH
jgi:sugar phosphate permease